MKNNPIYIVMLLFCHVILPYEVTAMLELMIALLVRPPMAHLRISFRKLKSTPEIQNPVYIYKYP